MGLTNVTTIAAGWLHGMAITSNGLVVVWGSYVLIASYPYKIIGAAAASLPTFSQRIVAVAGGSAHSLALTESGKVVVWGVNNDRNQLDMPSGLGPPRVYNGKRRSLSQIRSLLEPQPGILTDLQLGEEYTVEPNPPPAAQDPWMGSNSGAMFGGAFEGYHIPPTEGSGLTTSNTNGAITSTSGAYEDTTANSGAVVIAISANGVNSIALLSNGSVVVWGDNSHRQLSVPTSVSTVQVTMVTAGWLHYVVVFAVDAGVAAWGLNDGGECNIPAGLTGVTAVSAGYRYSSVLLDDGTFQVWGIMYGVGDSTLPDVYGVMAVAAGFEQLVVMSDCYAQPPPPSPPTPPPPSPSPSPPSPR